MTADQLAELEGDAIVSAGGPRTTGDAAERQLLRSVGDALREARAALLLDLDEGYDPARRRAVQVVEGALDLIRLRERGP